MVTSYFNLPPRNPRVYSRGFFRSSLKISYIFVVTFKKKYFLIRFARLQILVAIFVIIAGLSGLPAAVSGR